MDYEQIRYEVADGVLTITLNRPDRLNAFTETMMNELIAAFDASDADDDVRAVIVTGAGRGFCAGADLAAGGETFDYRRRIDAGDVPRDGGGRVVLRIYDSLKPVIAAINGPAVGVGITMTLPMDIRLAVDGAKIGFVFTRRGMEWVSTGRVFSAQEALEAGLVRSLHPGGELLHAARELAREIAENTAPVSVALARKLMWHGLGASHPMDAHRSESRAMLARGQSADAVEGVTAFLEKRPASYPDRVSAGLPDLGLEEEPQWS